MDGSPAMVQEAKARLGPGVDVRVADLTELELELEAPVDAILSTATFHWIPDHDRLFAHLHAALRPGGRLAAAGFTDVWTWRQTVRVEPDDPHEYFATIMLGSHLERIAPERRHGFVEAVLENLIKVSPARRVAGDSPSAMLARRAAASSMTSSRLQKAKRTSVRAVPGSAQNTEVGIATTPARAGRSRQKAAPSS